MTNAGPRWSRPEASLLEVMAERLAAAPHAPLYTFLGRNGDETDNASCEEILRRAAGAARLLESANVRAGDRVLLVFPPDGLELIACLFGCMLLGAVAVPVASPDPRNLAQELPRLRHLAQDSGAKVALTHATYGAIVTLATARDRVERWVKGGSAEAWPELTWLLSTRIRRATPADARERLAESVRRVRGDDVAYLQYTSGSTSAPKGVVVRHRNLLHNLELIARNTHVDARSVLVGWVPLFHDMGLAGGILNALNTGARCVFFSPMTFLANPRLWLEAIDRYGGTHIAGPNFGYDYVLRGLRDGDRFDLSTLRATLQGGEPMRVATMERFDATARPMGFDRASFCNVYGMAEAVLFITGQTGRNPTLLAADRAALERDGAFVPPSTDAPSVTLVGSGTPDAALGVSVIAVDPATGAPREAGQVGELWVSSPSVATGYWGRGDAENAAVFAARLATADGEGGAGGARTFLRTGDLGFVRDGEVFLCGRLKDMIIVGGRNVYPQDLEDAVVAADPIVRPGNAVVFGVEIDDAERVVVVAEVRSKVLTDAALPSLAARAAAAIRTAVAARGVSCHEVVLVEPGRLPKTTSGKLQRGESKARWQDGSLRSSARLATPAARRSKDRDTASASAAGAATSGRDDAHRGPSSAVTPQDLLRATQSEVAAVLRLPDLADVGVDTPLLELGLDSLAFLELGTRLEDRFGVPVPPAAVDGSATLRTLATAITEGLAKGAPSEASLATAHEAALHPGEVPFSPAQLHSLRLGQWSWWNRAVLLTVERRLDREQLARIASALVAHHPALRLRFRAEPGGAFVQRYGSVADSVAVESCVLTAAGDDARLAELRERLNAQHRGIDVERGPLLRLLLIEGLGPRPCLFLAINHLAMDAVTLGILVSDLDRLHQLDARGLPLRLPPESTRFEDYARWAAQFAREGALEDLDFWRAQLDAPLPCGYDSRTSPAIEMGDLAGASLRFTEQETLALRSVRAGGARVPVATTLLAALVRTAQRRWRCGRLVVELSSHGRQTQVHGLDLSRTAGDIECSFPLAFDDTSGQSPAQTLSAVRRRMTSVPSAGLSFDALAQLNPDATVRESLLGLPGPTLWFNFQGELQLRSRPSGLFSAHEAPLGDPWDPTVHVKQPPLYLECVIVNGALRADWYYSPRHLSWTDTEVEAWSNHLRDEVRIITEAGTP